MDQLQQRKLAIIVVGIGITAIVSLWQQSIEPAFFYRNFTASLWADLQSDHLTINIFSNVPGMKPWLAIVSIVSGIPLEELSAIPFGASVRALLYAAIVHRITERIDLSAGIGFVTLIYPWSGWAYNSIFVHSLGGFIFLSIILLILIIVDNHHDGRYSVIAIGFLLALLFFDYIPSAWATIMFLNLIPVAVNRPSLRVSGVVVLTIVAAVFFSMKRTVGTFIGMWDGETPFIIAEYFLANDGGGASQYAFTPRGFGLGFASYVYLLIAIGIALYGVSLLRILIKTKSLRNMIDQISTRELVIGAAIVGGVITTLLYSLIGRFSQFFIFLMGPLTGLLAIWYSAPKIPQLREYRLVMSVIFVVFVIAFVGVEFGYQMHTGEIDQYPEADGESTAIWISTYTTNNQISVKTDLITAGRMRMASEQAPAEFEWVWYDEESYQAIVEHGPPPDADFIVIDLKSKAGVRTMIGYARFESFGDYQERIDTNPQMNRVYYDGTHAIFR